MSTQAVITGLGDALVADQSAGSFYDDLGGRIYEGVAPERDGNGEETPLPLMVFVQVSDPPMNYLGGTSDIEMQVQIDLYGERSLGAKALGDIHAKVLAAMEGASIAIAGYVGGQLEFTERGRRSIDGDAHRVTMEAIITANE